MQSTPRSSLEYGTKLVTPGRGRWSFTLFPGAAEGGGSFRATLSSERGTGELGPDGRDPAADAARRARTKVRRYCAEHRLNRLGTLTYRGEGCHDPQQLRHDVGAFFRRLKLLVGDRFPYVWVPEWHPLGHGLHAHFAIGRWINYRLIRAAWVHGNIDIRLLGHLPVGSGTLGEARLAARYLAKYAGKAMDSGREAGLHRYDVAQGYQPRGVVLDAPTTDEVLAWAESYMGAPPERLWRSRDEDDWRGPPAVWASWS